MIGEYRFLCSRNTGMRMARVVVDSSHSERWELPTALSLRSTSRLYAEAVVAGIRRAQRAHVERSAGSAFAVVVTTVVEYPADSTGRRRGVRCGYCTLRAATAITNISFASYALWLRTRSVRERAATCLPTSINPPNFAA